MTRLMLDSNTCIHILRFQPEHLRRRMRDSAPGEIAISSIVSAELWLGVAASRDQARNRAAVIEFLRFVSVLDWPADAARIYGDLRAHLERAGRVIGAMDMLIAAHALHERATLITDNLAEFRRVPELKLENWIR